MTLSDELSKLAELRSSGSLTDEEFVRAKERLLQSERAPPGDPVMAAVSSFRRNRSDRWLGGICGGLGRSTGTESWIWRLIFAALFICAGAGLVVYLLLWIFVPAE